jgi:rfaE bifunctional protein nucleotidyltransferase chain/domain
MSTQPITEDHARPIVLAHGCFDLLHLGHIRHLEEAADLGKTLIVSVTADRYVNKGPGRPHFTAEQRAEALRSLGVVDVVIVNDGPSAVEAIKAIKPDVYVKGVDYAAKPDDPGLAAEKRAVEEVGGRLHVTTAAKYSSTELLRGVRLPDATLAYLEQARQRGFLDQILTAIDAADEMSIAFVGETIMDTYHYVRPLGKPPKESVLATRSDGVETFDGGIVAAAKHGGWKAEVITSMHYVTKTRYVDRDFSRKLFEVYSGLNEELMLSERRAFQIELRRAVKECDLIVLVDFGHGLMGEEERQIINKDVKFLAVNAQTNAGNFGFNSVTKYHGMADYVCVDEPEARLAVRASAAPLYNVAVVLRQDMLAENLVITRGRLGALACCDKEDIEVPPVVSGPVVDTMGAGDAFLAASAPLVAVGLPIELAAFVGNVAGGLKTSILGHSQYVSRVDLVKNLEWLLK